MDKNKRGWKQGKELGVAGVVGRGVGKKDKNRELFQLHFEGKLFLTYVNGCFLNTYYM